MIFASSRSFTFGWRLNFSSLTRNSDHFQSVSVFLGIQQRPLADSVVSRWTIGFLWVEDEIVSGLSKVVIHAIVLSTKQSLCALQQMDSWDKSQVLRKHKPSVARLEATKNKSIMICLSNFSLIVSVLLHPWTVVLYLVNHSRPH